MIFQLHNTFLNKSIKSINICIKSLIVAFLKLSFTILIENMFDYLFLQNNSNDYQTYMISINSVSNKLYYKLYHKLYYANDKKSRNSNFKILR